MALILYKFEFEIKMSCSLCETAIKATFNSFSDTRLVSLDRAAQRVVIETSACSSSVILNRLISTGRSAALLSDSVNVTSSGEHFCSDECGMATCCPKLCCLPLSDSTSFDFVKDNVEGLRPGERVIRFVSCSPSSSDDLVEAVDALDSSASLCKRRRKSCDRRIAVHLQQLLTPEVDCPMDHLVPAVVAHLEDRRALHSLLKRLAEHWPLPSTLRHVKRVDSTNYLVSSRVRVILCEGGVDAALKVEWPAEVPRDSLHQVWLPLAPCSREQHFRANAHWPCNFHPHQEAVDSVSLFSDDEFALHVQCLLKLQMQQAACAIDCCTGEELAFCTAINDSTHVWERHVVMQLVDLVARGQGGGAYWSLSRALPDGWRCTDRRHASSTDYLCSNATVYLTAEPCVLCAGALLHSRVRRVFFMDCSNLSNLHSGGAWTRCKASRIHCVPGVNHHYQVFRCTLTPLFQ